MRHARFAAMTIAVALAIAACSGSATPAPSAQPSAAQSAAAPAAGGSAVSIANFAFAPASMTVAVGTTVTWTNTDSAGHTVTADDGSFKSDKLGTGATFSQTFTKAGTFAYHCSIHSSMTGTITVH
jgi:plastocyanin